MERQTADTQLSVWALTDEGPHCTDTHRIAHVLCMQAFNGRFSRNMFSKLDASLDVLVETIFYAKPTVRLAREVKTIQYQNMYLGA